MSRTPHDALFKAVFSDPARAMDEIRAVLAPQASRHLDFASAELVPGSFVDEVLKERQTDLLFRLNIHGREAFAYLLFEHQSAPDALMLFRLLRYMVRIWERWLAEHAGATRLPAILPLVLSHGLRGWTAPTRLAEVYDLAPDALVDFARWLPDFETSVDDLAARSDDELRGRAMDALAKLVVLMLKHSRTEDDLVAKLLSWDDLIRHVVHAPSGRAAFGLVLRYLLNVRTVDQEQLGQLLEAKVGPQAREAMMTTGDELREQGRQEGRKQGVQQGRQEGVQQGRQEGVQQGMRQTLLRLLERRFGEPAPEVVARIEAAAPDQLEGWTDRVLTAPTLEAVFAD